MISVVTIGIIATLFAYIAQFKELRFCLKISFLIIFLFLALRYNYGPDYETYRDLFLSIDQFGLEDIKDIWMKTFFFNLIGSDKLGGYTGSTEVGWQALCFLFQPLGFFAMVATLALFNCLVYYYFIKKYVPPAYYWFAVFLYVFTPDLMIVHASAMRQSVAISIFLLSINYIYKKDFPRYALLIFIATLFHTTAIILLPVYLLGALNFKTNLPAAIGIFAVFLLLFLLKGPLSQIMGTFTYATKYEIYNESTITGGALTISFYAIILILLLLYDRYQNKEISLLFKIAALNIFMIPLVFIMGMIGRLGMYFQPLLFFVVYPFVLLRMDKIIPKYPLLFRYSFMVIIGFYAIYMFWNFVQSPESWKMTFRTYDMIFSSPVIY